MQIIATPRYPQLLTDDESITSAEFDVRANNKDIPSCSGDAQVSKPSKRSIRFYEVVCVRPTTHLKDMTDDEIRDTWYTQEDMTDIKRRMTADVKHWVSGQPMSESLHTNRGIEFRTHEASAKRRTRKFEAINAVLVEQDLQKLRGTEHYSPEGLRSVYAPHALRCLQAAQLLAIRDELECITIRNMDLEIVRVQQQRTQVAAEIKKEPNKRGNMFKRLFAKKEVVVQSSSRP